MKEMTRNWTWTQTWTCDGIPILRLEGTLENQNSPLHREAKELLYKPCNIGMLIIAVYKF